MKKLLLLLLLLLSGIFCFASELSIEGYNNFKWGTEKKVIIKSLGNDYKVVPENNTSINSISYDKKIPIGNLEISGVKLIFKNDKLVEWDGWENMSPENFMKLIGIYAEKYGDNFYFSDYGKSGCTFTYFGERGMVQIGGRMTTQNEISVTVINRVAFTEEEKTNWLQGYNEHKELNEAANRTIKKGQDFIKNSNPYTREPDRTVK